MNGPPIACDLTKLGPEERRRERELLEWFRGATTAAAETADGWRFELPADAATLARLGELLALERHCCPFLTFRLEIVAGSPAALEISGPVGARELVAAEFR
jgi:hypothetical protein